MMSRSKWTLFEFSHHFFIILVIFFNWDSLHASLNSHYETWSYKKKKYKKIKAYRKSLYKEATVNRCLLILDFQPFRLQVKGNRSIGGLFQSLAVRGNKLLAQPYLYYLGIVTEKLYNLRITSRPPSKKRKWNQLSQF